MRSQGLFRSAPQALLARAYLSNPHHVHSIHQPSKCLYYTTISSTLSPSHQPEDLQPLFLKASQTFPSSLREDKWYLTATASLLSIGEAGRVGTLYTHLIAEPSYQTPAQRQHLVRRLRETIIKCVILCGIPKAMEAIMSVAKVEREEDMDYTLIRPGWLPDDANRERAEETLAALYRGDDKRITGTFKSHQDMTWISTNISYGLFLSDHRVLDILESELVILPAIMAQDLRSETEWHIRGCRNLGVSDADIQRVQATVDVIAAHFGVRLHRAARVEAVGRERLVVE